MIPHFNIVGPLVVVCVVLFVNVNLPLSEDDKAITETGKQKQIEKCKSILTE